MKYYLAYLIYTLISVFITYKVGHRLNKDGGTWINSLVTEENVAKQINSLLLLGYYLVNIGFIFYAFSTWGKIESWEDILIILSHKISIILSLLGYLHYQNIIIIYIYFKFKNKLKWKL